MKKNILVLFETSGGVSVPFREAGFNVTTIDILPHKVDNVHHIQADLRNIDTLSIDYSKYDLLIAFPPCTYFSKAGLHYLRTQPGRKEKQLADLDMILHLWNLPIKHKCFENPAGSALNKLWKNILVVSIIANMQISKSQQIYGLRTYHHFYLSK